jgi:hypothetical protein
MKHIIARKLIFVLYKDILNYLMHLLKYSKHKKNNLYLFVLFQVLYLSHYSEAAPVKRA